MAGETPSKKKEPTASEAMFFFAIVKHTRNKADIDWNAVAIEQGFKNADVAKVRFGQVKRKLGISTSEVPASTSASRTTPTKNRGAGTPTKVAKTPAGRAGTRGRARAKSIKHEEQSDDGSDHEADDDDETVAGIGLKTEPEDPDAELQEEVRAFLNDNDDPF